MNRVYTAAQLAFVKRGRRLPRQELLRSFKRKFRRRGMTLSRLQDLCNRMGWGVGPRKGRARGSRRYSKAELAFISRRRKLSRRDLQAAFVAAFGRRDVTVENIRQLCMRNGWQTDPRQRRRRTLGRTKFSKSEQAFLRRRQQMPRRELHAAYVEKFGREISLEALKALCDRLGLRTGRTGGFEKGMVPANKGKKMPFNANSARTQFKKGQPCRNTKPLGWVYTDRDGYVLISIAERNPHTGFKRRFVFKHRLLWEKAHGPIPKGMVLKCKGEKANSEPSNWELIPRGVLTRLNKRGGFADAPAELKPTLMAIAKLQHETGKRRRQLTQGSVTR